LASEGYFMDDEKSELLLYTMSALAGLDGTTRLRYLEDKLKKKYKKKLLSYPRIISLMKI
jgi:hypothetical protein